MDVMNCSNVLSISLDDSWRHSVRTESLWGSWNAPHQHTVLRTPAVLPEVELLEHPCSDFAACVSLSWNRPQAWVGRLSCLSFESQSLAPCGRPPSTVPSWAYYRANLLLWSVSRTLTVHSVWWGHHWLSAGQCNKWAPGQPHPVARPWTSIPRSLCPSHLPSTPVKDKAIFLSHVLLTKEAISFSKSKPRLALDSPVRSLVRSPLDLPGSPRHGTRSSVKGAARHFPSSPLLTRGWILSPSGRPDVLPRTHPAAVFWAEPSSFAVQFL